MAIKPIIMTRIVRQRAIVPVYRSSRKESFWDREVSYKTSIYKVVLGHRILVHEYYMIWTVYRSGGHVEKKYVYHNTLPTTRMNQAVEDYEPHQLFNV